MSQEPSLHPSSLHLHISYDQSLRDDYIHAETYHVALPVGRLPLDRRCLPSIYYKVGAVNGKNRKCKGCVLLVPGLACNRKVFDLSGGNIHIDAHAEILVNTNDGLIVAGDSFMDFLAKKGYDVFATDLRGTTEANALGVPSPTGLREMVEIDLPHVVNFIKSITKHTRIYMMGHSLGGAFVLAYTGLYPDNVQGVIHLTGAYNGFIPIFTTVVKAMPSIVQQSIITSARGLEKVLAAGISAYKSLSSLFLPSSSSASNRSSSSTGTDFSHVTAVQSRNGGRSSHLQRWLRYIHQQPIPVKDLLNILYYGTSFLPKSIANFVLYHCLYPSPFYPNSCKNPLDFSRAAVENPTWGLYFACMRWGIHDDYYRYVHDVSSSDSIVIRHELSDLYTGLTAFDKTHTPVLFAYANQDGVLDVQETIESYERSQSAWKHVVHYSLDPVKEKVHLEKAAKKTPMAKENRQRKEEHRISTSVGQKTLPSRDIFSGDSHGKRVAGPKKPSAEAQDTATFPPSPSQISPIKSYAMPAKLSFGHTDVFGGKDALILWNVIAEWLDDTVQREQAWYHFRRHSC